ncbi:MAG: hypothetical protein M1281_06295 [Chloroflexi bacterium]|nr:hypothetical protein [Chloroflexota bacterium]
MIVDSISGIISLKRRQHVTGGQHHPGLQVVQSLQLHSPGGGHGLPDHRKTFWRAEPLRCTRDPGWEQYESQWQ